MTANGAPLADSSEEEEGEEDPEAEEESEDTSTPSPSSSMSVLRKRDLSPSLTWDQSDGQMNSACTAHNGKDAFP